MHAVTQPARGRWTAIRALCAAVLFGTLLACPNPQPSGTSSSSSGGPTDASTSGTSDAGRDGGLPPGHRVCGNTSCTAIQVCILSLDGGQCARRCTPDAGCSSAESCVPLAADGGLRACVPGKGIGDECEPEPCIDPFVCAFEADASARCRYPCDTDPDASVPCPTNWVCFPYADASAGACLPR